MLDLFFGDGFNSISIQKKGYEFITLVFDQKFSPDILTDFLTWDYQSTFPPGYFETIAASTPCTEYSIAMTCRARDLDMADAIVRRTIDIIGYFQPRIWFIENPQTGLLKGRDFMQPYGYVDVDYCQFCDWGYQKPTRVWGPMYFQKGNLEPVMGQLVQI